MCSEYVHLKESLILSFNSTDKHAALAHAGGVPW